MALNPLSIRTCKPETDGLSLQACIVQLRAVAGQLLSMADGQIRTFQGSRDVDVTLSRPPSDDPHELLTRGQLVALAAEAYRLRRQRDDLFAPIAADLFAEPAWDMLLYLFIQKLRRHKVRKRAVISASCVPATTAWRWVAQLENAGLVQSIRSGEDRRVVTLELTGKGHERMVRYFCEPVADPSEALLAEIEAYPARAVSALRETEDEALSIAQVDMAVRLLRLVPRLGNKGARLLCMLFETPGTFLDFAALRAVLAQSNRASPVNVNRHISRLCMVLRGQGIERAILSGRGGYALSPDAASKLRDMLHA